MFGVGMQEKLEELVREIQNRCDEEGRWELKTDELMWFLETDTTRFYRDLYSLRDKLHFSGSIKGFSYESVGDLLTLLEIHTGCEVESLFTRAGLFLPHSYRIDLTEGFLYVVNKSLAAHFIQYEEMAAMLRYKKNFDMAFALYLEEYFSREELMEESVHEFLQIRPPGPFSESTALRYLKTLFVMNVLEWEKLFVLLFLKMKNYFVSPGEGKADRGAGSEEDARVREALDILGCDESFTAGDLKEQYKKMMKKYHPDINNEGLEMSKKLNIAYGFLLSRVA